MSTFEQPEREELLKLQEEALELDRGATWGVKTGDYDTFQQAVDFAVDKEEPKEWTEENIKAWLVKLRAEVIGYYERQLNDPKERSFARRKLEKLSRQSDTELFWSNTNNFDCHFPDQIYRDRTTKNPKKEPDPKDAIFQEIDHILADMKISNDEAATLITQAGVGLSDGSITPELKKKYCKLVTDVYIEMRKRGYMRDQLVR